MSINPVWPGGVSPTEVLLHNEIQSLREQLKEAERQRDELNRLCQFNERTMSAILAQRDELKADAERLDWLLSKVGVSRDNGRSYVWMPGGSTKLDAEDRLESIRAIDAAIAAARKEQT